MRLTLAVTLSLSCLSALAGDPASATATGVVFNDANRNGVRDPGEKGLAGVRVSNGREVVRTDAQGAYRLPVSDDTILFVVKPRGWMTPVNELNLSRFYYIHKPAGSPKLKYPGVAPTGPLPASVDFALYERPEPDRFDVLIFGDTQPDSLADIDYLSHDIVEQVIGTQAAFGLTLGDLVNEKLDLHEPLNRAIALVGVPWYNVLGNHDQDYEAADDRHADDVFERTYGPAYYSFDYGPVHFIVLDSVLWHGKKADKNGDYTGGLGPEQMEFLTSDLKLVPQDQLVVLTMHIPMIEFEDRAELYRLLAEHPHAVSFSAHYHIQRHWFLGKEDGWPGAEPHHLTTVATACGSWWRGALDEVGLPHATMTDGTPNGWSIATFDGNRCSVRFCPARRPANYQMNIYAPDAVAADHAAQTEVLVNVFAGSERSTVEMRLGEGEWVKLERVEREDPSYAALKQAEEDNPPPAGRKLPKIQKSDHIWRGMLPDQLPRGTHVIEVRTTDVYGQSFTGRRVIRIE